VPINGAALVATTLRVVLLPVVVGMALKASSPKATQQLQAVAPLTCVGLVSLICGGIVAQNAGLLRGASMAAASAGGASAGVAGAWALLAAVALMHSGGFAFGYAAAWVCKQPPAVCRTVSIETGMQVVHEFLHLIH
jgi:BASS family bile acid:Na+ symporter